MNFIKFGKTIGLSLFLVLFAILFTSQNVVGSTILGTVYDSQRNPVSDVDVELLDDFYRAINRTKTSSLGRYEFGGLGDGRFTVRVLPFRYDLKDESAMVEISTMSSIPNQIGNGFFTQDFYLSPRKGGLLDMEVGVVFAQSVPKEAENIYNNALKSLSQNKIDEGISQLRTAVATFPQYYSALHRLGRELFFKENYEEAAPVFLSATAINPKSGASFYYLGSSLSKLNYSKAAVIALNQAAILAPSSDRVFFALGKAEIAEAKYADAEKHLLQAKKLSNGESPEINWELALLYGNNLRRYKEAAIELEQYLKSGKFDSQHISKVKKLISNLQEKAKTQTGKS